jgi:DNA polymerase
MTSYDASPYLPDQGGLASLHTAATHCHGCPLFQDATQTVFGEGAPDARIVLVGEQPGDQEDRRGQPFVGPAGRILDKALAEAGIDRAQTYDTNAVKHFKFTQRDGGKRRLHQTPDAKEITACRPWLAAELTALDPQVIVALGATAGKALLGPGFRVTKQRGTPLPCPPLDALGTPPPDGEQDARHIVATIHPSAVLRAPDRDDAYTGLLTDLRAAAALL